MVPLSVVALLAATVVSGYRYKNKLGHLDVSVSNALAVSHCEYAVKVEGTPSCQQLSDEIGIELRTFKALNSGLDCAQPFIKPNTLICVPFNPDPTLPDNDASLASNGTAISGNGTVASNATLTSNNSTTLATTTTTLPSPSPTVPPRPYVDAGSCKQVFDQARQYYNPGVDWLTWSDNLAGLAQYSADFSADNGCCDRSCHTLSGGGTGIAQVLYCSKTSCADAYDGWVTQESYYNGEHYLIIIGAPNNYPYFGCAVSTNNGGAIVCNTIDSDKMKLISIVSLLVASASFVAAGKKCAPKYEAPAPVVDDVYSVATTATTTTTTTTTIVASTTSVAPPPDAQPEVDAVVVEAPAPAEPAPAPAQDVEADSSAPAPAPQAEVNSSAPAPEPQAEADVQVFTCTAGSVAACAALTASDNPPNVSNLSVQDGCLALVNYARDHYSGAVPLKWNTQLAKYAVKSAQYAAENNCSHCHTNSGSGTTWGQNLYTGQGSCADSYFGWVTNEAAGNDPANIEAGHFKNIVGFEVDYIVVGCGSFVTANGKNKATVCNYGLVDIPTIPDN
ncbi:UNVERIFIED_CONTAM: hypothetical protein HDU68_011587 [Siphonaria sp. JEL0065]|nr:hypothetical protein HDU68_011587 [Siphonaria sp. JEL0065]